MAWYDKSWNSLGYDRGDIDYYAIDYSRYDSFEDAVPRECAVAMDVADMFHRVHYHANEIEWSLASVNTSTRVETTGAENLDGATDAGGYGCTEHGFWPVLSQCDIEGRTGNVLGGKYHPIMKRQQTLVIYTTLSPCLKCCNALYGLARELDMNIMVRCQQDYEFQGKGRVKCDFTVMIPRSSAITSVSTPAPGDRCVFVLHDGTMDFADLKIAQYKGDLRKITYGGLPHRNDQGQTCPDTRLDEPVNVWYPTCKTCEKVVELDRYGSGVPFADDYDPKKRSRFDIR